jgi:GT2 family glycosyltransferase
MKVTACVVNWNTAEHLPACLAALTAQSHPDLDVVVVDNASVDGSREVVRRFPGVRLVANATNRGFAGAANQGVALARESGSDAFLVCNPDATPRPDYLSAAVGALAAAGRRAAVQGRLWRTGGAGDTRIIDTTGHLAFRTRLFRNRGEGQADRGQFDAPGEVFGVSGALALYRVAALDDVACDGEVFDEDLFAFWEDVDLDWRLALRGWSAWYEPAACAWHERGGAGPRRSAVVEQLNFQNRLLVVLKNDSWPALARAFPGVALTTGLKAGELALTVPGAFLRSRAGLRLIPGALRRRRVVQATATVDPAAVVDRWFAPFDYPLWVRTWWRRVRG